ncbi:ead/Ea22-like family protein [Salmonella enterica]|nr:ead/Ea22-like family protein [Salmonella enterica]ELV2540259.1 ead/Ea22-like family protein [Salmonella enterica]
MSNIDKQALREEFRYMQDHYSDPADRERQEIYIAAEALLDENIQLQREKDAIEAVALALRDDMRQSREKLEAAERRIAETDQRNTALTARIEPMDRRIAELERSETQLINERDCAESALNDAYKAVMGQAPEWSNWFSFENAIDEIELVCELWRNQTDDVIQFRQRIAELEAREVTLPDQRFCPGEYVGSVLWAETEIWNKAISACDFAVRAAGIKVKGE